MPESVKSSGYVPRSGRSTVWLYMTLSHKDAETEVYLVCLADCEIASPISQNATGPECLRRFADADGFFFSSEIVMAGQVDRT